MSRTNIYNPIPIPEINKRYSEPSFFTSKGRVGRFSYFFYSTVVPFLIFWILAAFAGLFGKLGTIGEIAGYLLLSLAIVSSVVILFQLTIQRCHDLNVTGWLAAIIVIPFASFLFWLMPGSRGLNKYGDVPKPPSLLLKTGTLLLITLLVALITFGILRFYSII